MTGEDEYAWKRKNNILVSEILDSFHPILRFSWVTNTHGFGLLAKTEIIQIYFDGATELI